MFVLLLLIILFVLLSQLVGHAVTFYFPDALTNIKYKWPIGFFVILGLIQLVSFPMQYVHASMQTVSIIYTVVLLALIISLSFTLIKMSRDQRQAIFKWKSEYWFEYLLIGGFILFNFIICFSTNSFNDTNADQSFYITLVENNMDAAQINMIAPLSGKIEALQSLYSYQGFYLFLTYLASLFHIDSLLIMGWLVPILFWLTASTTFLNVSHYFNLSKKWWLAFSSFLLLWVIFDHFEYFVRYNVYGNNIRPLVFCYLMIFYYEYFKRPNTKSLILCALIWLSAIALQSTVLFLGVILMVSYGLYEVFYHRKQLLIPLILSTIPLMIYLSLFMKSRGSWLTGIGLFILLLICSLCQLSEKTKLGLNKLIYSKTMRVIVGIGVLGMMGLSIWMTPHLSPSSSVSPRELLHFFSDQYRLKASYFSSPYEWPLALIVVLRWGMIGLIIYALFKWKSLSDLIKWLLVTQFIMIIVFYNPLVCGLISTALTGIVYTRIHEIVMSLVIITALISLGYKSKTVKVLLVILSCLSMAYLGIKTIGYLKTEFNQIGELTTYNHLYRLEQEMIDVSNRLEETIEGEDQNRPLVLTAHLQLNYLSHNYEMLYTVNQDRHLYDEAARQKDANLYLLREVLKKSYEVDQNDLQQFVSLVKSYEVDYIITQQDMSPLVLEVLDGEYELIYTNSAYRLYQVKR